MNYDGHALARFAPGASASPRNCRAPAELDPSTRISPGLESRTASASPWSAWSSECGCIRPLNSSRRFRISRPWISRGLQCSQCGLWILSSEERMHRIFTTTSGDSGYCLRGCCVHVGTALRRGGTDYVMITDVVAMKMIAV
jgi:hypothetical protein